MKNATEQDLIDAIAELDRERKMRESVYPRWVRDGRMSPQLSMQRQSDLGKALRVLRELKADLYPPMELKL